MNSLTKCMTLLYRLQFNDSKNNMGLKVDIAGILFGIYFGKSIVLLILTFMSIGLYMFLVIFIVSRFIFDFDHAFDFSIEIGFYTSSCMSILVYTAISMNFAIRFVLEYRIISILYDKGYNQISIQKALKLIEWNNSNTIKFTHVPQWEEIGVIPGCNLENIDSIR